MISKFWNYLKIKFSPNLKIFSCDGGGIKGLYTIKLINLIESEFNVKFRDLFDLFAGTSTGSIIAGGLAYGISSEELVDLYKNQAKNIFIKSSMSLGGLTKSRYSNQGLKKVLKELLGDITLSKLGKNIFITSVNITKGEPVFFTNNTKDTKLMDAILASTAAPVYFNPYQINNELFVDGGVWANNPTASAIIYAFDYFQKPLNKIKVLSLGTGQGAGPYFNKQKKTKNWGLAKWEFRLLRLMTDSPSLGSNKLIQKVLRKKSYLRLNNQEPKFIMLDDIKKIPQLETAAKNTFYQKRNEIRRFISRL